MQIKLIFTRKVVHLASFWKWGFLELGSGYWLIASLLTIPETIAGLFLAQVSFSFVKWQINMHEQLRFGEKNHFLP